MRVSLFGGGTDRREWYQDNSGQVVGFAINKYTYISLRKLPPFFSHKHRIVWSEIELPNSFDEIAHPAIRAILKKFAPDYGVEIHHSGDLPARSGLGTSSSFVVGLLNALYALEGHRIQPDSLAHAAIRLERDQLQENVGSQDQVWAAYGGFRRIVFHTDGHFTVETVVMGETRRKALLGSLMLFFTGLSRFGSEIAAEQVANIATQRVTLRSIQSMAAEASALLESPEADLDDIGRLLHESWKAKRGLGARVSTSEIDAIYASARKAGALGGKLLGAGGGGFMLFYVPVDQQAAVRSRLSALVEVPFDVSTEGSRIIFYE